MYSFTGCMCGHVRSTVRVEVRITGQYFSYLVLISGCQVTRLLGGKHLFPLSHLDGPLFYVCLCVCVCLCFMVIIVRGQFSPSTM